MNIPKDALFQIALEFNLADLLNFCATSKKINSQICQRNEIWYYKLKQDFPDWKQLKIDMSSKTVKDKYILLYNLTVLKEKLKLKKNIEQLYSLKYLTLTNKIKEFPKEICYLTNLQRLWMDYNEIKELPKEIGNLTALQDLYLGHNQIKELPKEIGNLTNLQILSLNNNQIKELPEEIGNLINLQILNLTSNQIEELSKEIGNLTNLQFLWYNKNKIKELPKEIDNLTNLRKLEFLPTIKK